MKHPAKLFAIIALTGILTAFVKCSPDYSNVENHNPVVITNDMTDITNTTAVGGGNVTSDGGYEITERGICWSTNEQPTIDDNSTSQGSGTGSFSIEMRNLNRNTIYHVRAYATNEQGTSYGTDKSFMTTDIVTYPVVTTIEVTEITEFTAVCGGNVISEGDGPVIARGVCYGTYEDPTVYDNKTVDGNGAGAFTSNLTNLEDETEYYVRAYATIAAGTVYGEQKTFTTPIHKTVPELTIYEPTEITGTTARCSAHVDSYGNCDMSEYGFCWSTSNNPTIIDHHVSAYNMGMNNYSHNITGLEPNTTYYVKAYAKNEKGTGYSEEVSITTLNNDNINAWLYYGGFDSYYGSWGLTNGGNDQWGVRFPENVMQQFAGTSITQIRSYFYEQGTYTLKIYKGGSTQPSTEIYSQSFNIVTQTGWNTITLNTPLAIDSSQSLWVTLCLSYNAGKYPKGSCTGVNNPDARWGCQNGSWYDVYYNNGNVDICWIIQAYVTTETKGEKGTEIMLPLTTGAPGQIKESTLRP